MYEKKVLLGLIRMHILHHATYEKGVYGSWLIDELKSHGYEISPGTIYPILHEMKNDGVLSVKEVNVNGKIRKLYLTTKKGNETLVKLTHFVRELESELL